MNPVIKQLNLTVKDLKDFEFPIAEHKAGEKKKTLHGRIVLDDKGAYKHVLYCTMDYSGLVVMSLSDLDAAVARYNGVQIPIGEPVEIVE